MDKTYQLFDQDYQRLMIFMKANYGINLERKQSLIEGRLSVMIQRRGFHSFAEYIDFAMADTTGGEASLLVSRLTTNYTFFMREEAHYRFLQNTALPELCADIRDHDLRIWSAGCSSGEEPYTTAMTLCDYFGGIHSAWDKTVLATDISENVLRIARQGVYPKETIAQVPQSWKSTYFREIDEDTVQVADEVRKQVVFGSFNLMSPTLPFRKPFHIIFCRNVMIYFDAPTKDALVNRYFRHLVPGGYLFIGMSETLPAKGEPFRQVQPSIYQKARV